MSNRRPLIQHRIFIAGLVIVALLAFWNIRLLWLQAAVSRSHTSLVERSVRQRERSIVLDSGRGHFYDRFGYPLTGSDIRTLALFPVQRATANEPVQAGSDESRALAELLRLLNVSPEQFESFMGGLRSPKLWPVNGRPIELTPGQSAQIEELRLPFAKVVPFRKRYANPQIAGHLIGYVGQNPERMSSESGRRRHPGPLASVNAVIGNAGLEKTFERWLAGIGPTTGALFTDGRNRPLRGMDMRLLKPHNPYYPVKIMTTIDAEVQRRIEAAMDRLHIDEGAVVVLDAASADTIALASRPAFDPEHIVPEQGAWSNRALKAAAPGSIFKTIVAAALLEERKAGLDDKFYCGGELGQYGFSCWKKDGHGEITLKEAYAKSCNIAFAHAARMVGGETMERYARKLGLSFPVGWTGDVPWEQAFRQWDAEEAGQIFDERTNKEDDGALVQTAIGQRDVRITPLQAANMVVTLLNDGKVRSPRIVKEMVFHNGRLLHSFPTLEAEGLQDRLHVSTSRALLAMMKEVVLTGTGQSLQKARWSLAGKSGTAQVKLGDGSEGVNQWFIGYGPTEQPAYAVAVAVLNRPGSASDHLATELFKEVMDIMEDAGKSYDKA